MYTFRFYNRDKTFSNPTEEELLANLPKPFEARVFLLHQHDHLVDKLVARDLPAGRDYAAPTR
jgi:hypothetical protein